MSEWIESDEMAPLWKLVDMTHNKDVMARERDEAQGTARRIPSSGRSASTSVSHS